MDLSTLAKQFCFYENLKPFSSWISLFGIVICKRSNQRNIEESKMEKTSSVKSIAPGRAGTVPPSQASLRKQQSPDPEPTCKPPPIPQYGFYLYSGTPKSDMARPKYRNNVLKPRGVHDFYNVMWDPHVYRGDTTRTFQVVEEERSKYIEAGPRKEMKKRAPRRLGGIDIPSTPPPALKETLVVDTDKFLVEEIPVIEECVQETQTDIFIKVIPEPPLVVAKIGFDVSTQLSPDELFDFDEEMNPIITTLASKVIEQSILETVEEEELKLLLDEYHAYEERRRQESVAKKHLEDSELKQWRLREWRTRGMTEELREEKKLETKVGGLQFSKAYLKLMVPHLLEELENDGFLEVVNATALTEKLMPWINEETVNEVGGVLVARAIVDDAINLNKDLRDKESKLFCRQLTNTPVAESVHGEGG